MLVLTRKEGETIVIDGGIEITISEIQGSRVRVAIKAPKSVGITRGELVDPPLVETCRDLTAERRSRSRCVATETC